jgi:hypothetical protein
MKKTVARVPADGGPAEERTSGDQEKWYREEQPDLVT